MLDATNPRALLCDELRGQASVEERRSGHSLQATPRLLRTAADAIEQLLEQRKRVLDLCDDPAQLNTIALRNSLQPFLNGWLKKANHEAQRHGFAESYRYDSNDRYLLDHILIFILAEIRAALEEPCKPTNS